jgi:hypothetical protein
MDATNLEPDLGLDYGREFAFGSNPYIWFAIW